MATSRNKSAAFGIILVVIGAAFLLRNLGIIPWQYINFIFNWKGILLLIGSVIIVTDNNKGPGIVMVAISGFFLLRDFFHDILNLDFLDWNVFWPILIIAGGVLIFFQRSGKLGNFNVNAWDRNRNDDRYSGDGYGDTYSEESGYSNSSNSTSSDDFLNVTAILGGGDITVTSNNFKGGKITCFMGGGNYDLSRAQIADGPVVIDFFAMFGGGAIIVPSHWKVTIEVNAILGGFNDSRKRLTTLQEGDGTQELILRGTAFLGGGEIKNFV